MADPNPPAVAQALLDGLVEALTQAERPVPERRYVHVGQVAFDCGELVVSLTDVFRGHPGFQLSDPVKCSDPLTFTLTATLTRCIPGLKGNRVPSATELHDAGVALIDDAWALARCLLLGYVDWPDGCAVVGFGPVTPQGPEGGVTALQFAVQVQP